MLCRCRDLSKGDTSGIKRKLEASESVAEGAQVTENQDEDSFDNNQEKLAPPTKKKKKKKKKKNEDGETLINVSEGLDEMENAPESEEESKVEGKKGKRKQKSKNGTLETLSSLSSHEDIGGKTDQVDSKPKGKKKKKKSNSVSDCPSSYEDVVAVNNGSVGNEIEEAASRPTQLSKNHRALKIDMSLSSSISDPNKSSSSSCGKSLVGKVLENGGCMDLPTKKTKKVSNKPAQDSPEPFAKFLKMTSTPAAFVRKAMVKAMSQTNPKKQIAEQVSRPTRCVQVCCFF